MGRREHRKWMGQGEEHHPSCDVNMRSGKSGQCTCHEEDQREARMEGAKRITTFSHRAIHVLAVMNQMQHMGEPITNEEGHHIGLTYTRLVEMLQELEGYRKNDPLHEPLIRALDRKREELVKLYLHIGRIREWIVTYTNIRTKLGPEGVIDHALYLLTKSRSAILTLRPTMMAEWDAINPLMRDDRTTEVAGL